MINVKCILGMPIKIEKVGMIYPLTVEEYIEYNNFFNVLYITKNLILQQIDDKVTRKEVEENFLNFDVIFQHTTHVQTCIGLLAICFKTENVKLDLKRRCILVNSKKVDRDNWDEIREIIIKINSLNIPKQAKTKELQEWFDKSRKAKANKGSNIQIEDVIESVMTFGGYTPEQIKKMTMYQLNKIFARIIKMSNFEINIHMLGLSDEIDLDYWCSHSIDEEEKLSSSLSSFKGELNQKIKS